MISGGAYSSLWTLFSRHRFSLAHNFCHHNNHNNNFFQCGLQVYVYPSVSQQQLDGARVDQVFLSSFQAISQATCPWPSPLMRDVCRIEEAGLSWFWICQIATKCLFRRCRRVPRGSGYNISSLCIWQGKQPDKIQAARFERFRRFFDEGGWGS